MRDNNELYQFTLKSLLLLSHCGNNSVFIRTVESDIVSDNFDSLKIKIYVKKKKNSNNNNFNQHFYNLKENEKYYIQ